MFGLFKSKPKENLNEKPLTSVVPNAATVPTSNLVTTQVSTPPLTAQKKTGFLSSIKNKVGQTATTLIKGDPYNKFFENTQSVLETFKNNTDDNSQTVINGKQITIGELKQKYKNFLLSYKNLFKFLRLFFDEYIREKPLKISKYNMFVFLNDIYIYYKVSKPTEQNQNIVYSISTNEYYYVIDIKDILFEYILSKHPYIEFIINVDLFNLLYKKYIFGKNYITEKGFTGNFANLDPRDIKLVRSKYSYNYHYTHGYIKNDDLSDFNTYRIEALHRIVSIDVVNNASYKYFYDAINNEYLYGEPKFSNLHDETLYMWFPWKPPKNGGKQKKYKKTTQKNKKRRRRTLKR